MYDLILMMVFCAANLLCFLVGAKVGQTVVRGDSVELPRVNPMEAVRERQEKQAAKEEAERMETILRNIEAYDGTSRKQEDVGG